MEQGLLQKEVAARLGTTVPSDLNWEKNRSSPSLRFLPKIIEFLGYDPIGGRPESLGERLKAHRPKLGLSRKKLTALIRTDQSNVAGWETGTHRPTKRSLQIIDMLLMSNDQFKETDN